MNRRVAITGCFALLLVSVLAAGQARDRHQRQVGWASWYGAHHHGRKTASGERFSRHALTAAHRSLPLGTTVRVTNLDTGRQVNVTINDRGPFVDRSRRIIDLSQAAAERLGLQRQGVGRVRVDVLGESATRQPRHAPLVARSTLTRPPRPTGVERAPSAPQPALAARRKPERSAADSTVERVAWPRVLNQAEPMAPSPVSWPDCRVAAAMCLAGS
jgi:rare lipoprotein A